jgi:2-polyprenyl-3-methyl-5-hydroxy-6-metoxy-1,4-benzoquinol methylase
VASGVDFEYRTTGDEEFTVVRCNCGICYLDPRPADAAIASLYPPDYEPYRFDELPAPVRLGRAIVERRKVRRLTKLIPQNARVVDVGCGGGSLLRAMRRFGPGSWQLTGWDFPGPHLDHVAADGFATIAGDVSSARAPSGVDLFTLLQVIEHFAHPDEILTVLADALAPGGALVLETPDLDGLDARWFARRHWGGWHFPRHLVLFNARSLTRLVERVGLTVESVERLPSPAFWLQSFHHALVESRGAPLARLFTLKNPVAVAAATLFDLGSAPFHPTSNLRLIARRNT